MSKSKSLSSILPSVTVTGVSTSTDHDGPPPPGAASLQRPRRRRTRSGRNQVLITVEPVPDIGSDGEHNAVDPIELRRRQVKAYQTRGTDVHKDLPPQLSQEHITMISIGGVLGTSVFLYVTQSFSTGGPLGLLLGYSITGSVVYAVILSVAEIVTWLPNVGDMTSTVINSSRMLTFIQPGIVRLTDLHIDPALGFAMGWNACYDWVIIPLAETTAAAMYMSEYYQNPQWNPLVITAVLGAVVGISGFGARLYGNTEFWFAMEKVLTIFALISFLI